MGRNTLYTTRVKLSTLWIHRFLIIHIDFEYSGYQLSFRETNVHASFIKWMSIWRELHMKACTFTYGANKVQRLCTTSWSVWVENTSGEQWLRVLRFFFIIIKKKIHRKLFKYKKFALGVLIIAYHVSHQWAKCQISSTSDRNINRRPR